MDSFFILLLAIFILFGITMAIAIFTSTRHKTTKIAQAIDARAPFNIDIWREIGSATSAEISYGSTKGADSERGTSAALVHGVKLRLVRVEDLAVAGIRCELVLPVDAPLQLHISPQGPLAAITLLAAPEVKLGDPTFDAAFIVYAASAAEVLAYFDAPHRRDALLELQRRAQHPWRIEHGSVVCELPWALTAAQIAAALLPFIILTHRHIFGHDPETHIPHLDMGRA